MKYLHSKTLRSVLISTFFLVVILLSQSTFAARECWERNRHYPNEMETYLKYQTWCSEFTSRFDGTKDYLYLHFPPNFDRSKPTPVILWFRALGQSEGVLSDPRMFAKLEGERFPGIPALYNAIVISVAQRGTADGDFTCNFLGDFHHEDPGFCPNPSDASRQAAKKDIQELINQLSNRFKISNVFAAGASMGGYTALRLLQLYPEQFSGAITSAPALCVGSEKGPPTCEGRLAEGTAATYNAARAGKFDDKLIYVVVGDKDEEQLLKGDRYFNSIMKGKSWFRYVELAGREHENFFADDFNSEKLGYAAWLVDNPATPKLQEDIQNYMKTHPKASLTPTQGWTPPQNATQWYLTDRILNFVGTVAPK
jgi:pimeloyl-ACP methyl ester carboxylesterase